ncbi:MAG: DUF362 domain-containing protein [Firmicutes bacterium]|nr:DUF362 domain-containing protein [Bacillota bacterium]
MKSKVAIIECKTYDQAEVRQAVLKAVELLGGWQAFVQPSEEIILKPNLLTKCAPEKACTTHPAVFRAVGQLMQEAGYRNLKFGDSPGPSLAGVAAVADGCGILKEAQELNIPLADFEHGSKVEFPEGRTAKEFIICDGVLKADAIINICKMKTHQLERITGAVKNTFGCVHGVNKGAAHAVYPNADVFGQMIGDLNAFIKPRLHIMDGIVAMEGNGPQSGDPVAMNVILASSDPVAIDSIFCRLVHLEPALVATNVHGQNSGAGTMSEIEIITEDGIMTISEAVAMWGNPEFKVERQKEYKGRINMIKFIQPLLDKKPYVIKDKCVSCGICIEACPLDPKAIFFKNGKPAYNHRKCIKCYCCQEMCPKKAIDVKTTKLANLLNRQWKI